MQRLGEYIISGKDIRADEELAKHADWVDEFLPKYDAITEDNVDEILQTEIGIVFKKVLEHAGVYKNTGRRYECIHAVYPITLELEFAIMRYVLSH